MVAKRKLAVPENISVRTDDVPTVCKAFEAFGGTWDTTKWEEYLVGLSSEEAAAMRTQFSTKVNFESSSLALLKLHPAYKELEQLEARVDMTIRHVKQRMSDQLRAGFSTGEAFHRDDVVKLLNKVHPPPITAETLAAGSSHFNFGVGASSSSLFGQAPVAAPANPFSMFSVGAPSVRFGSASPFSSVDVPMACALELSTSVAPLSSDSDL